MSNQQPESLVKYDIPILVSTSVAGKKTKKKQQQLAPLEKTATTRNEDYLNSILPPREYTENGQLWVRYVSPTPATRVDVINLQDDLDKRLQSRQARETGICPIREELYAQCFDELIRQITIQCAERGFLLVRVRDEIKMTIQAYQTLYESSIAYGMRKALMAEQRKNDMQNSIRQLEEECESLTKEVERLEVDIDETIKRDEEERQREQRSPEDQVATLKEKNADYKSELETLLSTPKK
jgi:dynein light intermediate chain